MSRRLSALLSLGLAVVLFFALNIFVGGAFRQARLDLTENQLFTLNEGTIETLGAIDEPITLRLYYSEKAAKDYPPIATYARRVRDMLDAFVARAEGKIILEVVKPEPFSPEEDQAVAAGISGVPTNTGDKIYFGLEGSNLADGHEVIAYLSPNRQNLLEYDLVALVDRLAHLQKATIGLITGLPLATGPGGPYAALRGQSQPYLIYQELENKYEISFLPSSMIRVPDKVKVLLIAHPSGLSPRTLYAIDQFVLAGGRALVFVDPVSEIAIDSSRGAMDGQSTTASNLEPLLQAWGVNLPSNEVVGDRQLAIRVGLGDGGQRVVDFIAWLGITASEVNHDDPVTSEIELINLGTAGHLEHVKGATTTLTPLLTSSEESMILDARDLQYAPDPDGLLRRFQATGTRYTIAARITGPAKSAYPGGPPPTTAEDTAEDEAATDKPATPLAALKESLGPINVIVVADTDIFDDQFWTQNQNVMGQRVSVPSASNGDFVLNAVDNLMGSNALLSLRGRSVSPRRFDLVDSLRRDAETRYLAEAEQLNQRLADTQRTLKALEAQGGEGPDSGLAITPAQRSEIERFRRELSSTRIALRNVQASLRRDIDALGAWLKILNIGLMPVLVALAALGVALLTRRQRQRRSNNGGSPS